jgi:hypothetical protein
VNLETEEKKKSKVQPAVAKGGNGRCTAKWSKKGISPGISFRFEW